MSSLTAIECPLETATGAELVHVIRRTAARQRTSMSALMRGHMKRPDRFLSQLALVQRPAPATVALVREIVEQASS